MQRAGARSPQIAQRKRARCGSGCWHRSVCDERGGRQIAEARMSPHLVVVPTPSLNHDLCLGARRRIPARKGIRLKELAR